jgi:drug/metabolite transporter (DMT)-like permease
VGKQGKTQLLAKGTLLLTALIWGMGFIFSQLALDAGFGAAGLLLCKFGIATVIFAVVCGKHIFKNLKPRETVLSALVGVVLAGSFLGQTLGLKYSSPSNCALITAAYVVITPFLWWIFNKKRPGLPLFIASVLCLAGVALLSVSFTDGFHFGTGDLFTLGAAVLFAIQIVATESVVRKMDYRAMLFVQFFTAALCCLALFLITERDLSAILRPKGFLSALYLGAFSTCLCYFFQTSAQRFVQSSTAAILLSLECLFGAVFSVLLGYDPLSYRLVIGGALIFIAVVLPEIAHGRVRGVPGDGKTGI